MEIRVRVTPRADRDEAILGDDGTWRVRVTAPPVDGEATERARKLLAKALDVAPSRLELARGATSRDKVFRLT